MVKVGFDRESLSGKVILNRVWIYVLAVVHEKVSVLKIAKLLLEQPPISNFRCIRMVRLVSMSKNLSDNLNYLGALLG